MMDCQHSNEEPGDEHDLNASWYNLWLPPKLSSNLGALLRPRGYEVDVKQVSFLNLLNPFFQTSSPGNCIRLGHISRPGTISGNNQQILREKITNDLKNITRCLKDKDEGEYNCVKNAVFQLLSRFHFFNFFHGVTFLPSARVS